MPKRNGASVTVLICALPLLISALHAQEKCGVEVKLLLSPAEAPAAIATLKFEKETTGQVYFFDTDALDLLSKGVIVRLRQGAGDDLTVKVRPPLHAKFVDPSGGREEFKCEMDMIGGEATPSYSIRSKNAALPLPDAGSDIFSLLSEGQRKLLEEARVSIDWTRVKRIANIKSTDWDTKAQPLFDKLTLELWEWSAGSVLELSTKVGPHEGPPTNARLQRLVNVHGLSVSASQRSKTRMVLEGLTHHAAP